MRENRERVLDMLEAIQAIERYASRGEAEFRTNELVQIWILHHLQLIGEAAARLDDETKTAIPTVPWSEIIGMRNVLVHEYFGIDLDRVWSTTERDLPRLKEALIKYLGEEK